MIVGELWRRILFLLRRRHFDAELDQEMSLHLEQKIRRYREQGLASTEHEIRRRFGNRTRWKEESREVWTSRWLAEAAQDLRYGFRMLAKSPGFTAVAVATIALGIGANTAVFSIINGALLRPLPYYDPDRLVVIWDKGIGESNLAKIFDSYQDFQAWQTHSRTLEQIAATTWAVGPQVLTGHGPTRQVLAIPVSSGVFSMLGARAQIGRTFTAEDATRGCSVVLADRFWRDTLGAQTSTIGGSLRLNQRTCTILGVMPAAFSFYPRETQLWTLITPDFPIPPDKLIVGVFGRLKRGVTLAQAQTELAAIHHAIHQSDGRERTFTPVVYNLQQEFTWMAGRNLRTTLWVLLAAVTFVLFIACLNVASLLLGRSFARDREMAVRAALGSGQGRLVRQLLTEGLLLSFIGADAGVATAFAAIRYFQSANPVELPVGANIDISLPVLLFTVALSFFTALVFGLVPAWKVMRLDLNDVLKSSGRGLMLGATRQRLAKGLLAAEMALSVMLLAGAGLLIESVLQMSSAPLGFDPHHVMTAQITLAPDRYSDRSRRAQFFSELQRKLAALPGVENAALASSLPPIGGGFEAIEVEGHPPVNTATEVHDVSEREISSDYFRVLKMPLRSGRVFDPRDRIDSRPVAIVNEGLARRYFPHRDPIGSRIRIFDPRQTKPWLTIVGVVGDEKHAIVYQEMNWIEPLFLFRPVAQEPPVALSLAVRTAGDQPSVGAAIQREITTLDSDVPANAPSRLSDDISKLIAYPRFRAVLFAAFAGFALLLAAIGLHGILEQFVLQRTQEIGVRMALGAHSRDILRFVAKQGGIPVLGGLVLGVSAAIALSRYIASLLYGVHATDPLTFAAVISTLLLTAAVAVFIPARRAARVDPVTALRQE